MLHAYTRGTYVASISRQHPAADSYRAHEPWLVLHKSGRVDRFASLRDAREEVQKLWSPVTFKRV